VTTLPLIVPIAAISWELLSAEHVDVKENNCQENSQIRRNRRYRISTFTVILIILTVIKKAMYVTIACL